MNVAYNIRRIMNTHGYKQGHIAQRAGFSAGEFSAMMTGRKRIRVEYIPNIARALGVTPNDLFAEGGDDDAEN